MIVLTADSIEKSYTQRRILDGVSFTVEEGDKIGVIGVNGTGKSTLLKILAGVEEADRGEVSRGRGVRVGYLPQNPQFTQDATVLEQVRQSLVPGGERGDEYECKSILTRLGFTDFELPVSQLSGGQKRRVALARALACKVELLILDEPTNHVDSSMVEWLENALTRYRGALLMVTHDRYFLGRVTNRILELENGKLTSYSSGYERYLEQKAQREEMAVASERKRQSLLKKELEWLHQGPKARGTKSRYRMERYEELRSKEEPKALEKLELSSPSARLGKNIVTATGLGKTLEGKTLFRDFSYQFQRGDRVGIIGPNGCGKSTLLKILLGEIPPDTGEVHVGETVRFGYFSQEGEELDRTKRAIEAVRSVAPEIQTPEGPISASQMMERFLFPADLQYTPVGRLSGGERRRLALLMVLMGAPNFLLLDEPTNDLDIETLAVLEDYLDSFPGVVVAVSHDRYFLDKVVDHLFTFEGETLLHTLGGYTASLEILGERRGEGTAQEPPEKKARPPQRAKKLRFTYGEQREFEGIDKVIADLEEQMAALDRRMEASARDAQLLEALLREREALEADLSHQMDRWVYLNELAQRIETQDLDHGASPDAGDCSQDMH